MEKRITDETAALTALRDDFLAKSGWTVSYMTRRAVDANEKPLAWWSYPALDFIGGRLKKTMMAWEFGSGYSTLWMAERVSGIMSVDSDRKWHERMKTMVPDNVRLLLKSEPEYADSIREFKAEFDVVIIDGIDRNGCARRCIPALKDDGIIIFDNAGGRWQDGVLFLLHSGFKRLDFYGLAPICTYAVRTSVMYRPGNCFNI